MTDSSHEHDHEHGQPELTEEEIAQLQAELERITVDDVLLQTVVTLLNLGARKGGLSDPNATPDLEQARMAIEGARALVPILEAKHGDKLGPVKDMLAQLQIAFVQASGAAAPGDAAPAGETPSEGAGPAQQSGRLWVPGQ